MSKGIHSSQIGQDLKRHLGEKWAIVEEIISWLDDEKFEGVICPVCGQNYKWRKVRLGRRELKSLTRLYLYDRRQGEPRKFYLRAVFDPPGTQSGAFYQCVHWGLVVARKMADFHWMYSLTSLGRKFIDGNVAVPCAAFLHNGEVMQFDQERVRFRDLLRLPRAEYINCIRQDMRAQHIVV